MRDLFEYESPFWIFGKLADALFLENYMKRLLKKKRVDKADCRKRIMAKIFS